MMKNLDSFTTDALMYNATPDQIGAAIDSARRVHTAEIQIGEVRHRLSVAIHRGERLRGGVPMGSLAKRALSVAWGSV